MTKRYQKIVRRKIPRIIKQNGGTPEYRKIGGKELVRFLKAKIIEEAVEVRDAHAEDELLDELADLQSAIEALLTVKHINKTNFETVMKSKIIKQGDYIFGDVDGGEQVYSAMFLEEVDEHK